MNRRSFTTRLLSLGTLFAAPHAEAQLVWTTRDWKLGDFQTILHEQAELKQLFDITQIENGNSLAKVKNSLNGLHYGFGVPTAQIRLVAGMHGPSNLLNFTDEIWQRYPLGEFLNLTDPATGKPATRNMYLHSKFSAERAASTTHDDPSDENSPLQDATIEGLMRRGVRFLGCHTALEEQVRQLRAKFSLAQEQETIVHDMLAHAVPGSLFVASMVSAIALLQAKGGYTYVSV